MLYMKKYPAAGGLSQACPILGTACHADYAESTLGSLKADFQLRVFLRTSTHVKL
jgi:hypothetical protein